MSPLHPPTVVGLIAEALLVGTCAWLFVEIVTDIIGAVIGLDENTEDEE